MFDTRISLRASGSVAAATLAFACFAGLQGTAMASSSPQLSAQAVPAKSCPHDGVCVWTVTRSVCTEGGGTVRPSPSGRGLECYGGSYDGAEVL